jgi:tetratricopeptide (TPR) repeat protein
MRKILSAIILVLLFTGAECLGRYEPLANEDKTGLYVRSIESMLRLEADEVDLATAVLIISEQWNDNVMGRRYVSVIDDMAYEVRERLKAKGLKANYRAIPVINKYLFDELGFKSVKEASEPKDLFLHSVLDNKRGYCLSLSILYLSLAERLGLALYGVVVPGHFFVRYDDGQVRFNIETTGEGGSASDEHYINKFKVPDGIGASKRTLSRLGNPIYMQNLDKMQTLGCFFNNLGNSYIDVGNIEQALVALERAVEINPSLAECRTNLGNIYLKKDRIEDAINQYRTALQINPADAKTHNNLGNAYTKAGRLGDAISEYSESLELDPNFTEVYTNLSVVYCEKKMFATAESVLKEAIAIEPRKGGFYINLGNVYNQMGQCEKAIIQYNRALKLTSDTAEAHYGMGLCYNKLGMVDDEIRAYEEALSIEPDMIAALANLGNAYFAKADYDAAIEQYKKAVRIKPDDPAIHYNLGAAHSNKADYQKAVAEHLRAVELEPEMADAHNGLAFAYYKLEEYERAYKHIKIAEQLGAETNEELTAAIENNRR